MKESDAQAIAYRVPLYSRSYRNHNL